MHPLRKQMDDDMVLRGMAVRPRESYLKAVAGLAKHYHRALDSDQRSRSAAISAVSTHRAQARVEQLQYCHPWS